MTLLITLGIIFSLMLGFSISGLFISSKLANQSGIVRGMTLVFMGSMVSVFVMVLMVFIVWPTHMVI